MEQEMGGNATMGGRLGRRDDGTGDWADATMGQEKSLRFLLYLFFTSMDTVSPILSVNML